MTNFEYIKSLSLNELAEWIEANVVLEDGPHIKWFDKKFCKKCPPIECQYTDLYGLKVSYSFCELEEHCRFFPETIGAK